MTEPAPYPASTFPPPSPNGSAPPTKPAPPAPAAAEPAPTPSAASPASPASPARRGRPGSRIGQARTALIAGAVLLILVLIFIIENARAVTIVYFGVHLRLSLAVALLLAAVGRGARHGRCGNRAHHAAAAEHAPQPAAVPRRLMIREWSGLISGAYRQV